MKRSVAALLLALALVSASPRAAQGQAAELQQKQAATIIKAINYDANLSKRTPEAVSIVVLFEGAPAEADARALAGALLAEVRSLFKSKTVGVEAARLTSFQELLKLLQSKEVSALYIHSSVKKGVPVILQATRSEQVLSVTGNPRLVERGVALGVYEQGGDISLAVNLRAAKAEGAELDAMFLSLVKVIR